MGIRNRWRRVKRGAALPERPLGTFTTERERGSWHVPSGIRTRVLALKGPRPGPLDDGDEGRKPEILPPINHATVESASRSSTRGYDPARKDSPSREGGSSVLRTISQTAERSPVRQSRPRHPQQHRRGRETEAEDQPHPFHIRRFCLSREHSPDMH